MSVQYIQELEAQLEAAHKKIKKLKNERNSYKALAEESSPVGKVNKLLSVLAHKEKQVAKLIEENEKLKRPRILHEAPDLPQYAKLFKTQLSRRPELKPIFRHYFGCTKRLSELVHSQDFSQLSVTLLGFISDVLSSGRAQSTPPEEVLHTSSSLSVEAEHMLGTLGHHTTRLTELNNKLSLYMNEARLGYP